MESKVKKCSHCGRLLPFDKFAKRAGSKDGLQYICRDCNADMAVKRSASKKKGKLIPLRTEAKPVIPSPIMGEVNDATKLADFSVKDIVGELRRRNYRGTIECVHVVKI